MPTPSNLDGEERRLWRELTAAHDFKDTSSLSLLHTTLEAHKRARLCREVIDKEGMMTADRFGQRKAHPLLSAERDARAAFIAGMRTLALDLVGLTR